MKWYSSKELAALDLPGLSPDRDYINQLAKKYNWEHRRRSGRGGGKEYPATALPASARKALSKRLLVAPAEKINLPAEVSKLIPDARFVKGWQLHAAEARATLIAYVESLRAVHAISLGNAIETLVGVLEEAKNTKDLDKETENLVKTAAIANRRGGKLGERTVSRPTMYRWIKERDEAGGIGSCSESASGKNELSMGCGIHAYLCPSDKPEYFRKLAGFEERMERVVTDSTAS